MGWDGLVRMEGFGEVNNPGTDDESAGGGVGGSGVKKGGNIGGDNRSICS